MHYRSRSLRLNALALATAMAFSGAQAAGPDAALDLEAKINVRALAGEVQYDRFIVRFNEGSSERTSIKAMGNRLQALSKASGSPMRHLRRLAIGSDLVELPKRLGPAAAEAFMRRLAADPSVEYVEPDAIMRPLLTPNDTYYSSQWHYHEATGGLRLPAAWDSATGSGVVVAVLDTGITSHSDLNGNIVAGYDFISDAATARDGNGRDSNPADQGDWFAANECGVPYSSNSSWHGTHVAGTVAAVSNNSKGVAGVAFNAKVQPVRVLGKCGGSTSDIADAIVWASGGSVSGVPANATPAEVINMSLGGGGACGSTFQNAINSAVNRGSVVVVAAGNDNTNVSNASPANCSNVIAVAANDRQGNRASYSNYGTLIDVTAPGGETATTTNGVRSTLNSGTTTPSSESYAYYQGTSMAAPHVAGVVALMQSVAAKSPSEVESILKSTARALPGSCSGGCGAGIVDAAAAVAAVGGGGGGDTVLDNGETISPISGGSGSQQYWTMSVPSGASNLVISTSGGTGDADLYVKRGTQPTTSSYDCRPYKNGNNESCSFATPAAGTWHIMLRGYTSYSGVALSGSFQEPSSAPCTNCTKYTGSLSGNGDYDIHPNGTYYQSTVSGSHQGWLEGPSGTDFDLRLYKWNGSSWSQVASSLSSGSSESISYSGTSGYYYWRIESYSGSGSYDFWLKRP